MAEPLAVAVALRLGAFTLDVELSTRGTIALFGPNGAGKSTLLLAALGALSVDRGRVALGTRVLFDRAAGVEVPIEARRFGYVPQDPSLLPHLRARENVELALALRMPELSRVARRERALSWLARFEAGAFAERRPSALSGGEQQKVALARALCAAPSALLLDEPLSALDLASRPRMRSALANAVRELDVPMLLVTHALEDASALGADVLTLDGGRVGTRPVLDLPSEART